MSNLEKLVNIVQEEHAKSVIKLYSKLVEYKDFTNKQGYDDDFNQIVEALIDSLNEVMEEK